MSDTTRSVCDPTDCGWPECHCLAPADSAPRHYDYPVRTPAPLDNFDESLDHAMNAIADKLPEAEQVALEAGAALVPKATPMRNRYPRV